MGAWKGMDPAKWAEQAKEKVEAIRRAAVQELAEEMSRTIANGGRVPVDTGNLARSLTLQIGKPVKEVAVGPHAPKEFGIELLAAKGDETIYLGYQANYARRMNYGFVGTDSMGRTYGSAQAVITTGYSNRSGFGFVEAAAAKWPSIVASIAAKVAK